MHFMVSVLNDTLDFAPADEMTAIDVFNDKLVADGHWVLAGGLSFPAEATVIDNRADAGLVTDGPFIESKEFIAGFWVIKADSLDAALALAKEGSKACNRRVEVRPLLGDGAV